MSQLLVFRITTENKITCYHSGLRKYRISYLIRILNHLRKNRISYLKRFIFVSCINALCHSLCATRSVPLALIISLLHRKK